MVTNKTDYLVNTSPTYVWKNVGDVKGAMMTCFMPTHKGSRIFQGNMRHLMVYRIKNEGYDLGKRTPSQSRE